MRGRRHARRDHRCASRTRGTVARGRLPRADGQRRSRHESMIAAFAYLIGRSTRNKWVSQVKRIRNPRYAIAVLLGIGYFVLLSFNMERNSPPPTQVASV